MAQIFDVETFPYQGLIYSSGILEKPKGARGKKYEKKIVNAICAFDIETTNLTYRSNFRVDYSAKNWTDIFNINDVSFCERKYATMYVWQFAFTKDFIVIGRTWLEFFVFLERLEKCLNKNEYLVIYVHNLSFEFQFLKGVLDFKPENVFAVDSRKILTARVNDHFEFRCSYLLSNMSLSEFTENMNVEHKKQSGEEFDYSKQRFPWTKLTEKELKYCIHDVIGLVEALEVLMDSDNDNLYTVPMTSTGYVRRDMKAAMKNLHYKYWQMLQPSLSTYTMLRAAFRGGNTHANRWYVGDSNSLSRIFDNYGVYTFDISSSYPAVMLNGLFPVTDFKIVDTPTFEKFTVLRNKENNGHKKFAMLIEIKLANLRLKHSEWGVPYLSKDKCKVTKYIDGSKIHDTGVYDNGRILQAAELTTTITDIDYEIIEKEYDFNVVEISQLQIAKYGYLPECIKDVVRKYFKLKTELKQDKKDKDYDETQEVFYIKAKNKLNACYGLFATNPVRAIIELCALTDNDDNVIHDFCGKECQTFSRINPDLNAIESQLDELYKRPVFPYQWGVWVTALARMQLEKGIDLVYKHYDPCNCYFVYCDTDSVKYVDTYKKVDWSELNNSIREMSLKNGGVAKNKNGKEFVLGVYEFDGYAKRFRTMGAKRYAYIDDKDGLHITIAGVGKEKGAKELEKMGGLNAFKDDMTFTKAGGQIATYNDFEAPPLITAFGDTLRLTSNVHLEDTTKRISRTGEYILLTDTDPEERLNYIKLTLQMCKEYVNAIDI